jgi:hypothetical protein
MANEPIKSAVERTIGLFQLDSVPGPTPLQTPPRKALQLSLPLTGEQLVMPGCGEEDPAKLVRPQR